jgi:Na+-transporting methylmalonyl-CoA/oxaloacetate decarboxylase gamma subunit
MLLRSGKSRRGRDRRRGVAVLEMAIILPVLLLLIVGMYELSQLVRIRQVLDAATRDAARQASLGQRPVNTADPSNPALGTVKDVIQGYLSLQGFNVDGLQVAVTGTGGGADLDPRTLNSSIGGAIGRFRLTATIPYDNDGSGAGNRLISIPMKIISVPTITSTAEWYSMKNFPITNDTLSPPIE